MSRSLENICIDNATEFGSTHSFPFYLSKRTARRRSSQLHRSCRLVRRLVRKSGKSSIYQEKNETRALRYFMDLSNTLINSQWKWTLFFMSLGFVLTWFIFACLWMIISLDNADFDQTDAEPCLSGMVGFAGYLLFSIETQTSIGYGSRFINHYCPEAIFLMCLQIGTGVCICGSLICIVYAKMIGPNRLHSTNCFSKHAVINQRDGVLCLIFRIRDSGARYECLTKVTAYLVQRRKEEVCLKSIKLDPVGILIWPVEVVHRINETSPFWDLSAKDLIIKRFEIIIEMEGTSSSTSRPSKTITSYLSREILWGHRFVPCIQWDRDKRSYVVKRSAFNKTEEVVTPLCSAQRLQEVYDELNVCKNQEFSLPSSPVASNRTTSDYGSLSPTTTLSPVTVHVDEPSKFRKLFKVTPASSSSSSSEGEEAEFTCEGLCTKDLSCDDLYKSLEQFVIQRGNNKEVIDKHHLKYNETAF